jgi:hypothetical protein
VLQPRPAAEASAKITEIAAERFTIVIVGRTSARRHPKSETVFAARLCSLPVQHPV